MDVSSNYSFNAPILRQLLKATVSFRQDWLGLPCLVQFLTWLHMSDYHNIWNTDDNRVT